MRSAQGARFAAVVAVTAVGAAACTPWTAKLVPVAPGSDDYHLPTTWQDVAQPIVLALIALLAGLWGLRPLLAAVAVTVSATVVYAVYGQFFADVIGANMWIVGAIFLAPAVFVGALLLSLLGDLLRRLSRRGGRRSGDGSGPVTNA